MTTLSVVTSALERSWTAIRTVFPNVAPATMVVYLHPAGDRKGHFRAKCWRQKSGKDVDEIHISSHVLHDGGREAFHVLLHESVHSACEATGQQDTSRQGRYHNRTFADVAAQQGLMVVPDRRIGFTTVGITDDCARAFRNAIEELDESIELWQDLVPRGPSGTRPGSRSLKAVCPTCGRIIRLSKTAFESGPIVCVPCDEPFGLDEQD